MMFAGPTLAGSALAQAEQEDTLAIDVSGNGFHGSYAPAGFLEVAGATVDQDGGVHLDGTLDQFIIVPDATNLRITTLSGVLSWEFWLHSASFAAEGGTTPRVWCHNVDASNQWAINLTQNGANGRLGIGVDFGGVTFSVTADAGVKDILANEWTHCVITMNATTPLLYVNTVLVATTSSLQGIGSGANMLFGRLAQNSSTGRYIEAIDEAALYPDVLTPLEILRHYAAAGGINTNYALRSQEFDNASWVKTRASVSANTLAAPNGSTTADTLIEDATASSTHYAFLSNLVSTPNTVYTFSVYAKTKERSQIRLYVQEGAAGAGFFYAYFDVTAGTVLTSTQGGTGQLLATSITSVGSGWYRCTVTGIYGTTGTTLDAFVQLAVGGTATYSGNGTSGLYIWGAQLEARAAVGRYIPTTSAAVTLGTYEAEILVDVPRGYWRLGEGQPQQLNSWPQKAIQVEVNGTSWREYARPNSLTIDDTQGEQVTCAFIAVNPGATPVMGNVVRMLYYDQVLFAGTVDRVRRTTNNTLTARLFECACVDWSQVLVRNKIERNFIDTPLTAIVDSLLDNELANEELTLGTTDRTTTLPLVDSRGGSAFDVLRDAAGVTGQTVYVDFNKAIQFRATTNAAAPLDLDFESVETASLSIDRETYRNVQRVRVTGTPPEGEEAGVTVQERSNASQIAERATIEGGTGRYESFEEVTHPTSNVAGDLALLGIGYANLRLATSGVPRQTLSCRVRSYGFRAGQFATVDISILGITGTWLIQRVSIREEDGRKLVHELELVQRSLQQRAYESWLRIVQGGKITVQMPSALTSNLATFNTPGADTWTVPAGITLVEFTCVGASGGGGGGLKFIQPPLFIFLNGGDGGNSGKAISVVTVSEGQVFDLLIGSAGTAGVNTEVPPGTVGTDGTDGSLSSVKLGAITHCQGDGGDKGLKAQTSDGADGGDGSGIGDAVTVGGGVTGGDGGTGSPFVQPTAGTDGYVEVRW